MRQIHGADRYFREHPDKDVHITQPDARGVVTIIARETYPERPRDYLNCMHIALFGTPTIPRMIEAYQAVNEAQRRYPGARLEMAGWSAGGVLPKLFWNQVSQGYGYNPGTYYGNLFDNNMYPNYRVERNGMDIVSMWGVRGAA